MDMLLVHGAWHGAWCWSELQAVLSARGVRAVAIDLPGHGARTSEAATWPAYVDAVRAALAGFERPPLVVGHSLAGGIITAAAEADPRALAALVYVCAFLPRPGQSVLELAQSETSLAGGEFRPETGDVVFSGAVAADLFFHDCPGRERWAARLIPELVAPTATPVDWTRAGAGGLPSYYVRCRDDRAISLAMQDRMIANTSMRRTYDLATGHSPFLAAPAALADILVEIGEEITA